MDPTLPAPLSCFGPLTSYSYELKSRLSSSPGSAKVLRLLDIAIAPSLAMQLKNRGTASDPRAGPTFALSIDEHTSEAVQVMIDATYIRTPPPPQPPRVCM